MEDLMSNMLRAAAGVKRRADEPALDLRTSKYLRHTCDSLIEQCDLRSGTDSNLDVQIKQEPLPGDSANPDITSCSRGVSVQKCFSTNQLSNVQVAEESGSQARLSPPHPFSIKALVGDVINKGSEEPTATTTVTATAVVYSFNSVQTRCMKIDVVAYWCHVCNELCVDLKDAQGHQYLHYVQGAKCNLKRCMFIQHGYVTRHVKLDDEKMQCGLCDKVVAHCFFTKHQRLHDGHFCDICNHEFFSNSRLQDHMNIHTGSTPFSCKICNRKFGKRSSLTQHQRYHRDHHSFKCGYCPKSFNSKYTRAVHERLHTGENPFKCQVPGCTRAFPQKIQLQLHMNSHPQRKDK